MSDISDIILNTDSYKASHWKQYPPDTTGMFSYIEARNTYEKNVMFFGLQVFLMDYMTKRVSAPNIDRAERFFRRHGEPFNRAGWEHILNEYDGYIPVTIKAVPEGMIIPTGNVLCTVECTDTEVFWIVSYIETALLRSIWYPSTVATYSHRCKRVIKDFMIRTSVNPKDIDFKLHDFGARGASSLETAGIGGCAHLVNFHGSDTIEGIRTANYYYDDEMSATSIPAMEHSTVTAWEKESESEAYANMLNLFAKPGAVLACVSDSYDIYYACDVIWGTKLKDKVIDSGAVVVVRPDSGPPAETVLSVVKILGDRFGFTINSKGFAVLNYVRVIQGDGIDLLAIYDICRTLEEEKWSIDNINFGMGGSLLQSHTRDDFGFSMKCSAIRVGDKWKEVSKSPVGSTEKHSKSGRISLYAKHKAHGIPDIITAKIADIDELTPYDEILQVVYDNGALQNTTTFKEVRERASLYL